MKRSKTNFTFFLVVTMLLFSGGATQQTVKKVSAMNTPLHQRLSPGRISKC